MNFLSKLKNLNKRKKIIIFIFFVFIIFSFLWWMLTNYVFYYVCVEYLIPIVAQFTGIQNSYIEWVVFSLPLYFNIFVAIIFAIIFGYVFFKKKYYN